MSIYGMLRTSTSGMSAQADRLSAVSDNIANISTTGYKRSSLEFSTLVLESGATTYESGSVEPHIRHSISEQGSFTYTNSVSDIAVQGDGFFVVNDPSGSTYLTRAGSFVMDGDGNLVNAAGMTLQGYSLEPGAAPPVANGTSGLVPVNLAAIGLRSTPTSEGELVAYLPAAATAVAPANLPSANAATAAFNGKTSLAVFDNLGSQVTLDVYFTKTGPETWDVAVYNKADAAPGGGFPYTSAALTTETLNFDATTGRLTTASTSGLSIAVPNGATLELDLTGSMQLATDYTVREVQVNGNAADAVDRVEINDDGYVFAVYESGARIASYRIPLATVRSPDNMMTISGNVFQATADSGDYVIRFPEDSNMGSIISGALEKSTVDLATELTNMIEAEKNYTANSKVFQTSADLMDVLNNLKR